VKIEDYNHLDYMWADDDNKWVNSVVATFLEGLKDKETTQKAFLSAN